MDISHRSPEEVIQGILDSTGLVSISTKELAEALETEVCILCLIAFIERNGGQSLYRAINTYMETVEGFEDPGPVLIFEPSDSWMWN